MSYTELLKPGNFYHLYNRGNSGCDLFREDGNYDYFLQLYDKYIPPVADTYAWVLIKNYPVHHRFCNDPSDYPWSSYKTCITLQPTKLKRDAVIGWFNDVGNFQYYHDQNIETDAIEKWLEI